MNMNTRVVRALGRVRKLLADPSHWTQGTFARDVTERDVNPNSPRAAKWCLVGAIDRTCRDNTLNYYVVNAVQGETYHREGRAIPTYNDYHHRTHQEILSVIDSALQNLQNENSEA